MRIDRPDAADTPPPRETTTKHESAPDAPAAEPTVEPDAEKRAARAVGYRATVDATYRAHAVDQGYERVSEIEKNMVTPAMRRIETEDPDRHLAGLDHRMKGKDRLTEKVWFDVAKKDRTVDEAFANVKDAIRYTFVYAEDTYAAGVNADCERIESAGFGRFDRRNSWDHEEYKGINSRWRIPGTNRLFEVQFHTQASLNAKEETHHAYERIRSLPDDDQELAQLRAYQRAVTSKVPIPPGAPGISEYRI